MGRPKGSKNKPKQNTSGKETGKSTEKRKPGRPKKNENELASKSNLNEPKQVISVTREDILKDGTFANQSYCTRCHAKLKECTCK